MRPGATEWMGGCRVDRVFADGCQSDVAGYAAVEVGRCTIHNHCICARLNHLYFSAWYLPIMMPWLCPPAQPQSWIASSDRLYESKQHGEKYSGKYSVRSIKPETPPPMVYWRCITLRPRLIRSTSLLPQALQLDVLYGYRVLVVPSIPFA